MKKFNTIIIILLLSIFTIIVAMNKKPKEYVSLRRVHLKDLNIDLLNYKKRDEIVEGIVAQKEYLKKRIAEDIMNKKFSNIYEIEYKDNFTVEGYIQELNEKDSIKCIEATILSPFAEEYNYIIDTTALFFIAYDRNEKPIIISYPEVYSRAFNNLSYIDYKTSATSSNISSDKRQLYLESRGKFIKREKLFLKKFIESSTEEKTTEMIIDLERDL